VFGVAGAFSDGFSLLPAVPDSDDESSRLHRLRRREHRRVLSGTTLKVFLNWRQDTPDRLSGQIALSGSFGFTNQELHENYPFHPSQVQFQWRGALEDAFAQTRQGTFSRGRARRPGE